MMPIDDAEVRWAIMKYLADRIDAGEVAPLIAAGLTPELVHALHHRSLRDLTRVAQDASVGFHLQLDSQRLTLAFLRLDAMQRDRELLEHFVRHGAPTPVLTRLFRVSHRELRALRRSLRRPKCERGGRPNLPDPATRERIHAAWAELAEASATEVSERQRERECLYALHQRFPNYTIGALWSVLNEFGDLDAPTNERRPGRRLHG
jgi:hypothetical protein